MRNKDYSPTITQYVIIMEGRETANAVIHIPTATMKPPRKATFRNVNLFIIGPLIRPKLHVIVPFK